MVAVWCRDTEGMWRGELSFSAVFARQQRMHLAAHSLEAARAAREAFPALQARWEVRAHPSCAGARAGDGLGLSGYDVM